MTYDVPPEKGLSEVIRPYPEDPGDGWSWVAAGDVLRENDEYHDYYHDGWVATSKAGRPVDAERQYRRRIEPLSDPYKLDDVVDQLFDNPGELPAVEPILRAMPLPTERVTEQLNAAVAKHAEVGFTHCFLLMVRKDGDSITTSMFYAPDQRTSEIIGVLESAKFDLMYDQKVADV